MTRDNIVGNNFKLYREHNGLTQDQVANYLNVTREEISYYENNKRKIPVKVLSKAASLFGIDEYDFYETDPEANNVKMALAFRSDSLSNEDLDQIAQFKKIVLNYLSMKKAMVK
ncbi:helix-turn-helix domain-containing protein [Marinigracilibium pacificum]|uniref:Helix-turn-helix transcriptional regulator n=1 Tax=Marinigracilibium pacificum TaxID=2729599 RepID=A0A848J9X2_9BACT|nr:helix-turn-helix transcriptional regulator [Marinigracilibium pacificum]NMM49842.1 helix-turn-helix transcriptional regulator [Marinigracilibium pacificum]